MLSPVTVSRLGATEVDSADTRPLVTGPAGAEHEAGAAGTVGSVVTNVTGPLPPDVSTEGVPTLSSAMTAAAVAEADPFLDRLKCVLALKLLRLTSITVPLPCSVFCLVASVAEPTTAFMVLVSVAVAPLSINIPEKLLALGLVSTLPKTLAFIVEARDG